MSTSGTFRLGVMLGDGIGPHDSTACPSRSGPS